MNYKKVLEEIGDTFGRLDIVATKGKFHGNKKGIISAMRIRLGIWRERI